MIASVPSGDASAGHADAASLQCWTPEAPSMDGQCPMDAWRWPVSHGRLALASVEWTP